MKILTLNYEYPPVGGGASPVSAQLCKQLVLAGHTVDVATMRYKNLSKQETVDGVNVYRVPSFRVRADICRTSEMATYIFGGLLPILNLCRKNKYDIIHTHFIIPSSPLAWAVSKITNLPYVITCHGSDVPGYNPDRFGFTHQLITPAWKQLTKATNLLISPSNCLKELIQKHSPETPVEIIPNGFDCSDFDTTVPKQKRILISGRLLPRKGFGEVIQAVKDLSLDWHLHIAGDGPDKKRLHELAKGSKTPIHFEGWLNRNDQRLRELYETSAIYAFPSAMENFPTVLLEAMSAGAAVITSTTGGCPEVVGDAALLIEPNNVPQLKQALLKLIESETLRKELSNKGYKQVKQFSWEYVTQKYLKAFEQVLEQ